MGKSKVGGWFLIGLVLPIVGMTLFAIVAGVGATPLLTLPFVITFFTVSWGISFLFRRHVTTSAYYDPRHAHRLFTPYYDKP